MHFTRRLRDPVRNGEITTSIRIWHRPRVTVGGRYALEDGHILVESIHAIALDEITPRMARESGFAGVADLLKVAMHGSGRNVYLVTFRFEGDD